MATFTKAVKRAAKLRMALSGPSGAGKTYTALMLARELAKGGSVAVIDTERGSASKYADLFDFDVLELDSFAPQKYIEAIRAAAAEGYAVVVIDSLSHAWNGTGGILEQVEQIGKRKYNGNSFKAWGDIKPIENALIEAITGTPLHILATMRSKTEYVVEQNERGKATPRKVGTAPIQRDGFEYEFDVFGEMTPDNELIIQKTRCPALTGQVIAKPGKALADTLATWLNGAAPVAPAPKPTPPTPTPIRRAPVADDEPAITFTEAAQADSDAVTDAAPRTVPLLFEAWKHASLPPGEFAPHARKAGPNIDQLIAAVWPRIQAARAGAASDYDLHDLPMAAHGSH